MNYSNNSISLGTAISNEKYDLISLLHHALKSIVIYEKYIKDAQKAEDSELITFFLEQREASRHAAEKAQRLDLLHNWSRNMILN